MARIRSLKPEFWDDRKLARSTSRDARMLYIALWNQADEHGRCNGDLEWIKGRVFPYESDLGADECARLLDELARGDWVRKYTVNGDPYLFLPKLAKHQRLEPAKVTSRLPAPEEADPETPPDQEESDGTDESAPGADQCAPGADESALLYVAGSRGQVAGGREASEAPPPSSVPAARDPDPPRPDVERICTHLADRIEGNGAKRPNVTQKWRDAARLMLDRDGRSEEQVHRAIDWCQDSEFWRSNVLSLPKLRDQYDRLSMQARSSRASPGDRRQQATNDLFDRAMQRAKAREEGG